MANTIVTDSYKFANVTSVSTGMDSGFKKVSDEMDFTQMLGNVAKDSAKTNPTDTVTKTQTVVEKSSKSNLSNPGSKVKENGNDISGKEKVASDINDKCKAVKSKIKDELGVSDEEFDSAMETLGLSMQDLMDPNKVKDLMMSLSGETDSLSILTNADLYDSMKNVFDLVTELRGNVIEEFNLSEEELGSILDDDSLFTDMVLLADETGKAGDAQDAAQLTDDFANAVEDSKAVMTDKTDIIDSLKDAGAGKASNELTDEQVEALTGQNRDTVSGDFYATKETSAESFAKSRADSSANLSVEVVEETEMKSVANVKAGENDSKDSLFGNNSQGANAFATNVSTTINTVGDVVEQITTYSSAQDANEIISQVTQQIKVNISPETTSMEMQLHPASLGTVNMQISSVNGTVTAHLTVQNEAVKAALESQLITLTQTFEEQGQKVEAVEVSVANYDLNRGMNNRENNNREQDAFRSEKSSRRIRNINLSELGEEEIAELDGEDKVSAEVMRANGTTVDFMA